MPLPDSLLTFGPIAAIMAGWQQVKGMLTRVTSYVIVSAQLETDVAYPFMDYLWDNFKVSRFGQKRYGANYPFVKPKGRYERVAFELLGAKMTAFKGWRPLFLSFDQADSRKTSTITISFVRGFFNMEKLLIASETRINSMATQSNGNRRFRVINIFGSGKSRSGGSVDDGETAKSQSDAPAQISERKPGIPWGARPLGWSLDDLGQPTSESPFMFLAYGENVEVIKTLLGQWHKSEQWYKEKGLDWRFGVCLYGKAGTGKTSFVRAMAQQLDLPIYKFDLNSMDNHELVNNWRKMMGEAPLIALFEDIDRMFDDKGNFRVSRNNTLTLDCLLNCISGVEPSNGVLTVITANNLTHIDKALGIPTPGSTSTRPGRIDKIVEFFALTESERGIVADRILCDFSPHERGIIVKESEGETGAQFSKRCEILAIERFWNKT